MKTNRNILKAVAAAVLALTADFAAASDTQTVSVTATVSQVCKFSGAAATIAFGTINPNTDTGEKTAAVSVPYKCTKGFAPTITRGTIVPLTNGAETMAFTVDAFSAANTGTGTGFTTAVNATSTARLAEAVYKDAAAGGYTGSIVLDINGGN